MKRPLKRWLLLSTIVALSLCLLWGAWAWIGHRRLQSRLDAIVALHQRITAADFEDPPVSDSQNAVKILDTAATMIDQKVDPPSNSNLVYPEYPLLMPAWQQAASAAVAANLKPLAMARAARNATGASWDISLMWRANGSGGLGAQRQLANLIGDSALYAHLQGDDAESVERIRDLLRQSDAVGSRPSIIHRLVAVGIEAIALHDIELIAPDLKIQDSSTNASSNAFPVSSASTRDLIAQMLDDGAERDAHRRAMECSRQSQILECENLSRTQYLLKPLWEIDTARVLDCRAKELRAIECPDFPLAREVLASGPQIKAMAFNPGTTNVARRFSRVISEQSWSGDLYVALYWKIVADRRVAAISLAIQLYRADHHSWPATLASLVPAYLPTLPTDPYLAGNVPVGYVVLPGALPNGEDRPMVYIDAGSAAANRPPPAPCFGWQSQNGRQWRDLSRWTPPAPTTKP